MAFVVLAILIFFGLFTVLNLQELLALRYILGEGGLLPNGTMSLLTAMVLLLLTIKAQKLLVLLQENQKILHA